MEAQVQNLKENKRKTGAKSTTKELVVTALFTALVLVFTAFINIQLPIGANGGLIHLGNVPLLIAAILFGRKTGCIAGAIGMGLFDLLSGWAIWAPFTVVIVGLMGFFVGWITEKKEHQKLFWYVIAVVVACVIKVAGYYVAEVILYKNFIAPIASIPGNIIQVSVAGIITLPIVGQLRKILNKMDM